MTSNLIRLKFKSLIQLIQVKEMSLNLRVLMEFQDDTRPSVYFERYKNTELISINVFFFG